MNLELKINYLIATLVSNALVIVLNWYFSKILVFKRSRYKPIIELLLVFFGSLVGIAIQIGTIYLAVSRFQLLPLVGKCLAILVTFFWNYWFRNRHVFPLNPKQ